jgi:hypothetical protein
MDDTPGKCREKMARSANAVACAITHAREERLFILSMHHFLLFC